MILRRVSRSSLTSLALPICAMLLLPAGAAAQHAHHRMAHGAELAVRDDRAAGVMTVRLGPLELPARSGHHEVAQPPQRFIDVPFDGWLLSYRPRLVDGAGEAIPGRLLHHVAFWNVGRSDFLCPNKEEHIFGAGGELNEWVAVPGVGYPVSAGDRIRVTTMFHNPTAADHGEAYLEIEVRYRRAEDDGAALRNVYPVWFDVEECGSSDYDLEPGTNVHTGELTVPVAGRLLGVGGHLHDYGKELRLESVTRSEEIATLLPRTDEAGRLLSMPIVTFFERGGYLLEAGERVRVTARYDNPTGRRLPEGAMGIAVGYLLPDDDAHMRAFERREGRDDRVGGGMRP